MAEPHHIVTGWLREHLDLGPSGLTAFVGAGGKTTLTFRLAVELAATGARVVVTTTTKVGADQLPPGAVRSLPAAAAVEEAFTAAQIVMAVESADGHKATGGRADEVATLLTATSADHVLVEADGARRLPFKAPARHEPVVPAGTTLVVVCAGLDALGRTFASAAHRPETAAALARRTVTDPIRPEDMAAVLGHPDGGLKGVPPDARVVVALTKPPAPAGPAEAVAGHLGAVERIERVIIVPRSTPRPGPSTAR